MQRSYVKLNSQLNDSLQETLQGLVHDRVASRIFANDSGLWGSEAEQKAKNRLGWTDLFSESRELLPRIVELRDTLRSRSIRRIVLCGMGGSSLAPEVITASSKTPLVILDTTHPDTVTPIIESDLQNTAVIVSSKSGTTIETDSLRRIFEKALSDAGLPISDHMIAVTDGGSELDRIARANDYLAVFNSDPTVGGRYSALTAFGLVPSGLAGVDISPILDDAEEFANGLRKDSVSNPGLQLGAALARFSRLSLSNHDCLSPWVEQLVAESTGKQGRGILPVVSRGAPTESLAVNFESSESSITVRGSLGARFILWEFATAVSGRLLKVNPFDQPDVESSKSSTLKNLKFTKRTSTNTDPEDFIGILRNLLKTIPEDGYLAIHAYLDRSEYYGLEELQEYLARQTNHPVTFGWGPRFLHSTGQFHKGGPKTGAFLQITDIPRSDVLVPEMNFSLGELINSQADGDQEVLQSLGLPVTRIQLSSTSDQIVQLTSAARHLN